MCTLLYYVIDGLCSSFTAHKLFVAATLSALLDFCAVMASWEAEQRGSKWSPPVDTSRGNGGGHGPPTRPRGFEAISSELERYIISFLQQHSHIPQNFILLHREGCTVQLMCQNKKAVVIHQSAVSRTRGSKFKNTVNGGL
jgi:hypothetical protein